MSKTYNILSIGASQNIGYFTALNLLGAGHKITFLLRRKNTFDNDTKIQEYIKSGQVKLSFGDALSKDDVKKAWTVAEENGTLDYVIFTVGGRPSYSWTRGIYMKDPALVSQCMHAVLSAWPRPASPTEISPTKLIAITSNGLSKKSHAALPWLLKPLYNIVLSVPHLDKRTVEHYISQSAVTTPSESYKCSPEEIKQLTKSGHLFPNWEEGLHPGSWLEALIVRPSLFMGEQNKSFCEEKGFGAIRVGPEDTKKAWTISRMDVAWFIANKAVPEWEQWKCKGITITN